MLVIIPARGGSKGLPGKNIKSLNGMPLIAYSILAALRAKYVDKVIVSTDSEEIADVAKTFGAEVPFLRPTKLAQDNSKVIDAYCYMLENLNNNEGTSYEDFVALLPTAPLCTALDIDNAIELYRAKDADSVISVCETEIPPEWYLEVNSAGVIKKLFPNISGISKNRQEYKATYRPNGAIYILKHDILKEKQQYYTDKTFPYIMPKERSIDIDELLDFHFAESMIKKVSEREYELNA